MEKINSPEAAGMWWEPLSGQCCVLVSREHGFTTDTLLLADFSMPTAKEVCADFGTGCGVVPLIWSIRGKASVIYGVELQETAVNQAKASVEENKLDIEIIRGDVRKIKELFGHQQLDLVSCNPPYYPMGTGPVSRERSQRTARHDETLQLEELAVSARYALRQGGRLCICLPGERLSQAMAALSREGLEPKRLRLVQLRPGKRPYLFLLECRNGGRPGLTIEPVLMLEREQGVMSRELEEIYGDYRKNAGYKKNRKPEEESRC